MPPYIVAQMESLGSICGQVLGIHSLHHKIFLHVEERFIHLTVLEVPTGVSFLLDIGDTVGLNGMVPAPRSLGS
jgi:hypothetical protein